METIVLGLGVSGTAAVRFLLKQGKSVLGIDSNRNFLETKRHSFPPGPTYQHDTDPIDWKGVERVIVSPGISPNHPIYQTAIASGIEIIGETELALPHFRKPLVAITGTNGKTTVALLVEHILNAAGIKARALGNVGIPPCDYLCDYLLNPGPEEVFVVELSSFQLETLKTPLFYAAVLLNITPDHLDRYDDMQAYAKAKCQIQYLMKREGSFFVQTEVVNRFADLFPLKNYQTFGMEKGSDLWTDQTCLQYREKIEYLMPIEYREMGRHDNENALAAWALCKPFSISNAQFCSALATFRKPPHRIEWVKEIEGVSFYDDSKGTNIDAVIQAVGTMKGEVILIVGGVDKGASYLPWKERFLGKVKLIIAIGEAASKIYRELHPYFNIKLADSLAIAVEVAVKWAKRGDSVLLSPGCSSYDMFENYAHRGKEFQRHVHSIEVRKDP